MVIDYSSDFGTEDLRHAIRTSLIRQQSNNMLKFTVAQFSSSISSTLQSLTSHSLQWCTVLVSQYYSQLLPFLYLFYIWLRNRWSSIVTDFHPLMMRNLTRTFLQLWLTHHFYSCLSDIGCSQANNYTEMTSIIKNQAPQLNLDISGGISSFQKATKHPQHYHLFFYSGSSWLAPFSEINSINILLDGSQDKSKLVISKSMKT